MKNIALLSFLGATLTLAFVTQPVHAEMATAQERLYDALKDGADVNLGDKDTQYTPLVMAVTVPFVGPKIPMETRIKAIKTLIENGADVNVPVLIIALYNFIDVDTYADKADIKELISYVKIAKMLLKNAPASLMLQ